MSPEDALSWLLASDDGQALIGGYYSQAADAQIRNEILAEKPGEYTDPATGGIVNPEDLQAEIQARSDEAMRRAAGMLMTDILPPHVVERLRKTKPAFFPAETKAEEPAIVGRVTDAEAKESIKNMQAVSANALSQLVRHRDFSSPNEAIRFLMSNWFNRYLDEHVAKNTQTRQFRDRARRQVMDYLLNNWHQIEIMNDVFREEAKRKTAKKGRGKGDRGPLRGQIREAVERGLITP